MEPIANTDNLPLPALPLEPPGSIYAAFEVFPRPKGASTHIAAVVEALSRHNGPVWLFCCGSEGMDAIQREGPLVIWRYKQPHANMLRRAQGFGAFIRARLRPLGDRPLLALFRDPWGGVPLLHSLRRATTVFEVNALPSWELAYRYPRFAANAPLREMVREMERFCLEFSDAIFTVSDVTQEALKRSGVESSRISVVPNCASDIFFRAASADSNEPSVAPELFDRLNRGRWFGYVGSLHPWQGVDRLIEAWALVQSEWPDVRLLIVCGKRTASLRQLKKLIRRRGLTERVVLHAALPPDRLADAVARLEFTCAPLLETARNVVQGCCPIKIVESMAVGTPVLASDLRVTRRLVRHGVDGLLARPGDPRDWALALRRLLKDEALRLQLGREAARTAQACFTKQVMFDRLDQVFQFARSRSGRQTRGAEPDHCESAESNS